MIQSYKQNYKVADHYDAIVIGSGMGSLSTAALLSKDGQKVLVLERHYNPGGYTQVFKRNGYEWEVGIHYIGEVHKKRSLLRTLFDHITDGKLEWAEMESVHDRIVIGDKIYDYVSGKEGFRQQLVEYFPEEEEAIDKFIELVFAVGKAGNSFFMEKAMPPGVSGEMGEKMREPFLKYAIRSTQEVLEEITDNQELIQVLTGQFGDYGLPPKKSSFAAHAGLVRHYFDGANFPIGGAAEIGKNIAAVLEKTGSTILSNAEVTQILIEDGKAVGVKMADGKEFRANAVISGIGLNNSYKSLLPQEVFEKHELDKQLTKVKQASAHLCLYVGLKGTTEELNLSTANYWAHPGDVDHDACWDRYMEDPSHPFPLVFISFPSAKDPTWNERYPGKSTIDIVTVAPYDAFEKWADLPWKKRGEEYEAVKEEYSQRLLEELFKLEPQLRDKVDFYELSTPVSTKHFSNYSKGELYGLDHSPERFGYEFLRPHTPIKNYYLAGQDIVTAGIAGALFSGVIAASAVTKKNILDGILKG